MERDPNRPSPPAVCKVRGTARPPAPTLVAALDELLAEMECTTPAYGAPGHAHCAACCGGSGLAATCRAEEDLAHVLMAARRFVAARVEPSGEDDRHG